MSFAYLKWAQLTHSIATIAIAISGSLSPIPFIKVELHVNWVVIIGDDERYKERASKGASDGATADDRRDGLTDRHTPRSPNLWFLAFLALAMNALKTPMDGRTHCLKDMQGRSKVKERKERRRNH